MVALIVAVDGIGRKTTTTVLSLSGLYDNLNTNYSRHVVSTRQASSTGIFMTSAVPESPLFTGTDRYIATEDLKLAVNAALTLQRPLLIKGEPGTGKTMLAEEVAAALNRPLRSEEHTSELQSRGHLVCRLLLENNKTHTVYYRYSCSLISTSPLLVV